jgi:hypothetical protein
LLAVLIIVAFYDSRLKAETNCLNRYVTPSRTIRCFDDLVPCQTIEQYATHPEMYFANNTCFYFQPGNHQLNSSIKLANLRNASFKGLPDNNNIVNVFLGSFVNITWENCCLVQLTSINFILPDIYSFCIVFNQTQQIRLHNISVTANGHRSGCSGILSQRSEIIIRDCN